MNKITLGFFMAKSKTTTNGLWMLFALLLMNFQSSWGQLLQWNTLSNIGTETTEPSIANDANIAAASLTMGTITSASNGNRFGGSGWFNTGNTVAGNTLAEAVAGNDYIQFVVTPNSGYSFTPTSFVFKWDRSSTGPSNVTLRSSVDGFTADIGSVLGMVSGGAATSTDRTIIISGLTNITSATTFRIYGYGATATTGTGGFDCGAGSIVNVLLNGTTAVTWNGSVWSNTTGPTAAVDAIIDGDYDTVNNGVIYAKKLTINTGKTFTIGTNSNITIQNEVVNNGTFIIENNANLIQVNNTTNTGNIIVKRNSNALSRLDYTMWSSPVAGSQTLTNFSPLTTATRFYTYDNTLGTNGLFAEVASPSTTTFATGTGYLIRMPNTAVEAPSTEKFNGMFTGVPNNGPKGFSSLTAGKYYAVGNPYPSTVSATAFLAGNTNIDGTLYFWRKKNNINQGTSSTTSYATWTTAGGVANSGGGSTIEPSGILQVGQGFIVNTGTATILNFENTMRIIDNDDKILKTRKVVENNRVWLNLTNTSGAFSQTLVAYMDNATLGIDNGIDGKYINDSPIALTSNINNEEYVIQGRPSFDVSDVVALNFKTDLAGDYTIAVDHVDGLFATGQDIYLVDSKTGTETNLKEGSYTFNTTAGVDNARFSLKYQKTLKVEAPIFNENNVVVYKNEGTLFVNSTGKTIKAIQVYDIQGKLISEQNNVKSNATSIKNIKAANQVLIVKISDENNNVVVKKVLN